MKLKLAEIVLKWPQNGMKTKVTHIRVEVSRVNSISFPYFELSHTIVTFPYTLLYLRCYAMSYNKVHNTPKELGIPVVLIANCFAFSGM